MGSFLSRTIMTHQEKSDIILPIKQVQVCEPISIQYICEHAYDYNLSRYEALKQLVNYLDINNLFVEREVILILIKLWVEPQFIISLFQTQFLDVIFFDLFGDFNFKYNDSHNVS